MNSKFIEQKKILKLVCYRKVKFADCLCPFGFNEIVPQCQNCRWFTIEKVFDRKGKPIISDTELKIEDVAKLKDGHVEELILKEEA